MKQNNETVEIRESRNGKGLYALVGFNVGQIITEVKGVFMDCNEDDDIPEEIRSNTIRYDKNKYISPQGELANYINHSCDPNAYIGKEGKRLYIYARKKINQGDEITFDYSTILAPDDVWEMDCNCGTASCRGTVRQFRLLPRSLQRHYRTEGVVPRYIYRS